MVGLVQIGLEKFDFLGQCYNQKVVCCFAVLRHLPMWCFVKYPIMKQGMKKLLKSKTLRGAE